MRGEANPPGSRTGFLWWVLRTQWGWGLLSVGVMTDVSRPALLSAAAAFLAGIVLDRSARRREGWHRLGAPLALLASAAAAADLFLGSRDLLYSVSILVLGIQSVKFLLPKHSRDGWQLSLFSFLEFVAAAAATTEIRFAAFAFPYLGLSAGAMWALQIEARGEEGDETARLFRPRFAAALLLVSAAAGVLMAGILFAVTPRIGIGQILRRLGRAEALTGFSESISLREVTGVKTDRRVVARVEFPEIPQGLSPTGLYLRGATFSRFTGRAWIHPERFRFRVHRIGFLYPIAPTPPRARIAMAEITLEAADTAALFVYGYPCFIEGSLGEVWTEGHGSFSLGLSGNTVVRYRLQFSPDAVPPAPSPYGPQVSSDYLRLPPGYDDVRELAAGVAAGGKTDAERAELALRHFRSGFRYTISDPASSIREFLFVRKAGFCEHYATALALLLRGAGIPSRVAVGYLGGEWSEVGKYLIVRQSDAHAWTEGWIGGRWVTLDATPSLGERSPFYSRTGMMAFYLDWARQLWNKYVVNYDLTMQAEGVSLGWKALRRAKSRIENALGRESVPRMPAGRLSAFLLAAAAGLLVLLNFLYGGRREGEPGFGRTGDVLPPRPYARLIRRLAKAGYRGSPGATVEEMVLGAAAARPELSPAGFRFLSLYHRERFGPRPLSPDEFRESARLADRLGREIRRPRPGAR